MARLDNPRHEAFAQYVHEGYSTDEAYQRAGFKPHRGNASRLRTSESVQRRLAELAERAERTTDVTLQRLTDEYFNVLQMAKGQRDAQAARATLDSLAKLHGVWVDRQQVDNTTRVVSAEPMDEAAWEAAYGATESDAAGH